MEGMVVQKSSRDVRVETESGLLLCSLRGKLRAEGREGSPVVAGDRVLVSDLGKGQAVIEKILPRKSELTRATAGGRRRVVAANVDSVLVVVAARDPEPRWSLVDRMLVAAERQGLEPAVCVNKWDLVTPGDAQLESLLGLYRDLKYTVFAASARLGQGVEDLAGWLRMRVTVFSGHSGVGKTTLLSRLRPDLEFSTVEVNPVTGKGRHTTSFVRFVKLPGGGYAVDTPGFREFQLVELRPEELGRYYREFREIPGSCRYADCLHRTEPECAVRAGVDRGIISKIRYENYLHVLSALPGSPGHGSRN